MVRRYSLVIILMLVGCAPALWAYSNVSFAFTGGFSSATAVSASFRSETSAGQNFSGSPASLNYRNYLGILSVFVVVNDVIIAFMDESPSSSEWQLSPLLSPRITVETSGGNNIASVKYRISNAGADENRFFTWQSDVTAETALSPTKVVYRATLPNAAGQSFSESDSNYIQWRVKNSGNFETISGKYRVRVVANDNPAITIIQPDEKGGLAGVMPQIQARITDQYWGVDPNAVEARIDTADGANVYIARTAVKSDIYSTTTSLLSFQYDGTPLTPNTAYRLTVSALDRGGVAGTASVSFTAKGGAIADLVPYPSPFDPRKQPVTIRYVLNKRAEVSINIYDMGGRLVKNIINNEQKDAGISEDTWQGTNYSGDELANGVYFCEIVARDDEGEHRRYTSMGIFGK
ncbi:MAG: FlgD immunoglobulin-like domain containing protein [Endomicrobiales bacterium]